MPKRPRDEKAVKSNKKSKPSVLKKNIIEKRFGTKSERTAEVKLVDVDFAASPSTTGAVTLLNGMAQGTSVSTRVGQKIEITSVDYKFTYQANSTQLATYANAGNDHCFIALVYDRQSNGAAPAWSDIWTNTTTIQAPVAHRNVANLERFEVLAVEHFVVGGAGPGIEYKERHVRMSHDTRFNGGSAGTVADIQSGAFFIAYCNMNAIANVANSGILNGEVRVNFKDS